MLDYLKNNKILIMTSVFLVIILVFIIIEWYEFKKVRHRVIKLDKQMRLIEKNQLYLETLVAKEKSSLVKPTFVKGKSDSFLKKPSIVKPTVVKDKSTIFLSQPPPIIISHMNKLSQIFEEEEQKTKGEVYNFDDGKITEIDDSDDNIDPKIIEIDNETDQPFDEKTLDLELKNELKELN